MNETDRSATEPAGGPPLDCGVGLLPVPSHPEPHTYFWTPLEQLAIRAYAQACVNAAVERLSVGHDRYETVRRMNVPQFRDAFVLSNRTGKPFDEIVDDLRTFLRPNVRAKPGATVLRCDSA